MILRPFGCLRCYAVRNIQILSTDRILFYEHEIHIHMNSLTKELSNCSPNVSFLMKHCLFSESFKLSRTNSLELSVWMKSFLKLLNFTGQRYDKIWNSAPICLWQNVVMSQEVTWWKSFNPCPTSWKLADHVRLLLRFHDAVSSGHEQHALQPLALAVASARIFRAVAQRLVCGLIVICPIFSKKFNMKSGLFVHQPPTLPQKVDSRGDLFWCQKGVVVHVGKMNFYLSWPPRTPVLGRFAAKWSAFWC